MKALLLAAGEGTRLRPITEYLPKCLVPINGKPLLKYWLDNLSQAGIDEFLINTHYKANDVEEFIRQSHFQDRISLVYEKNLLNTAGPLIKNRDFFKKESFMLVHADNLSFCDFNKFIEAHKNRPKACEITMMLFKTDKPSSCGIVALDERGVVQAFYEKVQNPPSNLANGAVYICEPSVIDFVCSLDKEDADFSLDVLPHFLGKINTFMNDIYHRDIGTVESYALAQVEIQSLVAKKLKNL